MINPVFLTFLKSIESEIKFYVLIDSQFMIFEQLAKMVINEASKAELTYRKAYVH